MGSPALRTPDPGRKKNRRPHKCTCCCLSGMVTTTSLAVLLSFFLARFNSATQPPPPKLCGTPSGPLVTAPRVQLKDGRYLAYHQYGVPKENAKSKVVVVHGFGGYRMSLLPASQDLLEELGVYLVGFDRAGYGQSDPNPNRSLHSEAADIENLADALNLGLKFYIVAISIGGYSAWSCIKYIPHRLAGVAMLAPVTNYWWPGIPIPEALTAYFKQPLQDQFALAIAHYFPSLTYWWNTQTLFPKSSAIEWRMDFLSSIDKEIHRKATGRIRNNEAIQQSVHESLHRDMMIMFSSWEFDPGDLENPFTNGEGHVHIWHGNEDYLVPVMLQRYVHRRLPWVVYHELPRAGHLLTGVEGLPDRVLKALFLNTE